MTDNIIKQHESDLKQFLNSSETVDEGLFSKFANSSKLQKFIACTVLAVSALGIAGTISNNFTAETRNTTVAMKIVDADTYSYEDLQNSRLFSDYQESLKTQPKSSYDKAGENISEVNISVKTILIENAHLDAFKKELFEKAPSLQVLSNFQLQDLNRSPHSETFTFTTFTDAPKAGESKIGQTTIKVSSSDRQELSKMFKAVSAAHFLPEMGFSSYTEANNTIEKLNEAFESLPTIHKKIIEVKKNHGLNSLYTAVRENAYREFLFDVNAANYRETNQNILGELLVKNNLSSEVAKTNMEKESFLDSLAPSSVLARIKNLNKKEEPLDNMTSPLKINRRL